MTEVADQFTEDRSGEVTRISHWIDGQRVEGTSGRSGPVYNPATGEQSGEVDFASFEEVDAAVEAAKRAFASWRTISLSRRTELFFRIRELLHDHAEDIAKLLTLEHGKVLSDAKGEVARGLEVIEFCCGIPELLKGGYSEQASTGIDVYSIRQPLGVVGGITPFNFPAMVPMWMWAPAIACGNCFVLKPSEKDPSASMLTAELLKEAGLPDGVFNVVHGDKVAVDAVLEHQEIAAVSFVGSTPIARYVYETGTKNGKRVQALGGAKNHMIVLPDADISMAADAAVSAGYGSAGERCMAVSMLVCVGHAADDLVSAIQERLPKVRVGNGLDPDSEMGPLVTREHRDKVASYIDKGREEGAKVIADGRETAPDGDGFFLGVTLIDEVTPEMDVYKDEIFGPVLGITRVDTYEEAVRLVNENPYGNGVAIFTRDGGVARQFQFEVNAGMVGVNVPIPVPVAYYSFGGWKSSLFGDLHIYGPEGIQFYTQGKVVTSRWPDPATSKVDLGLPADAVNVGVALFDGAEELDWAGPWEVLAAWAEQWPDDGVHVFTLAREDRPVTCAKGLRVLPDETWETAPPLDVLVYPGGRGTRRELQDEAVLDWIRGLAAGETVVASVCTGSLVLAAAGLLDGKPATTHWGSLELLPKLGNGIEVRPDDRFVDNGNVLTAAGVSAGIDMALHLVARLHSTERAREVRRYIQYDPEPPV